jgi:hypothetical protein
LQGVSPAFLNPEHPLRMKETPTFFCSVRGIISEAGPYLDPAMPREPRPFSPSIYGRMDDRTDILITSHKTYSVLKERQNESDR